MSLVNIVYAHTETPGYAVHKRGSSVIWSREPVDGCDVYAYIGAFSYCGLQSGLDVLITLEPIVVLPGEYNDNVWQRFDHVLTFVDSLSELGGKFHKVIFPAFDFPFTKNYLKTVDYSHVRPLLEKKNAVCMISGNKTSGIPGELYSKRVEAARWFHEYSDIPFDVFGSPPFDLPNYRGRLTPHSQKLVTLAEYRYSLCFENIYNRFWSKGYLSEKMLDCLMCGTVPIYLGCYNVEEYVLPQCFIDFRQFKDYSELDQFLHNISDSKYKSYIEHARNWMEAGNLNRYSMHRVYDKLLSLADSAISEEHLAAEYWEPELAADHSKRKWQARPAFPVWSWRDLASAPPPEGIMHAEFTDKCAEDQANSGSFAGKGVAELDKQDVRHMLALKRIKDVNLSLLPEFLSEMAEMFDAEAFVETGTFMGGTANTARKFFQEIHTVELGQDLYEAAVKRFAGIDSCHVYQGDSADVLREIVPEIRGKILFWLDAHYSAGITAKGKINTPILSELEAIKASGIKDGTILIDDIRCFQHVQSHWGEDSALQGYPLLQEVRDMSLLINNEYEFVVLGDVALVYLPMNAVSISPLLEACTVSRLFAGSDTSAIENVFDAEKIIGAEKGQEGEVIQMLARSIFATGKSPVGGHYRLWYGLMLAGQNRHAEACKEFREAMDRGCNHWRILWYFAQSAYKAGQNNLAQRAARAVLNFVPEFEEAQVLLEQSSAIQRWFRNNGDGTLRLDYPLTENSVVFDVGGYKGEWSQQISTRYNPYIYIFEPVPKFYSLIVKKFMNNPKVSVFDFGLFDTTKNDTLMLDDDGSSLYGSGGETIEVPLMDVDKFLNYRDIKKIDLIKINVEGAEYPLLKCMIDKGIVEKCEDIQVQFHAFYPNAVKLRNEIRDALRNTHALTYDYPFVWENWTRDLPFADAPRVDKAGPEGERKTILLSYPRSGNSWLRYCIEFLTKRLTVGYDEDMAPIEGGMGRFADIGVDCAKPPIVYKRHGHTPSEKDSYDTINDRLILLVRNYKECMVAHGRHSGRGLLDKMFYSQTKGFRDGMLDYVGCLQIYEVWRGKKVLIYYEDLMRDPEPEFLKMLELLEIDRTYLPELMENLEFHKKQSVYLYSRNKRTKVGQSYTKGDVDKLTFHSKMLADEQKRGWDHHFKGNFPNITDKYLKRYMEPDVAEINGLIGLVFSKDRPMQLDATLRSFFMHCKDAEAIDIKVLYATSRDFYSRQYQQLFVDFPSVSFIKEKDFKADLLSLVSGFQEVLFFVDDNIFVRDFHVAHAIEELRKIHDAIGFSLRLGNNTDYCYMLKKQQAIPKFKIFPHSICQYEWISAEHDFSYPLELSSSIYRISDIYPLLEQLDYSNPNSLEFALDKSKHFFQAIVIKKSILCFQNSVTFCNPINMVQNMWRNRAGAKSSYSPEKLAEMYDEGYRIDIEHFSSFKPNSCHQEVDVKFVKTELPINECGKTPPLLSLLILNYNGLQHLQPCLDSIKRNTPQSHETIIIDNASTDGSLDYLRSRQDIILVENTKNLGCPPARAQLLSIARGKFVIFLDNDTIVTKGWAKKFLDYADSDQAIGMIGPKSNYVSGAQLIPNVQYTNVGEMERFAEEWAAQNKGDLTPTIRLVGFCMFITRQLINKIGSIDATFGRFGFEDDDYTWRANIAGFKTVIANDIFIHHTGGPQGRGDSSYNQLLLDAWDIVKKKWKLPKNLRYGQQFNLKAILEQPFDKKEHYIPLMDPCAIENLVYKKSLPQESMSPLKASNTVNAENPQYPQFKQESAISGMTSIIISVRSIHLSECFTSIKKYTEEPYEIIFLDNGAAPKLKNLVTKAIKENNNHKVIKSDKGANFTQSLNQGINESSGEYIVLLFDDVVVGKGWLSDMISCLKGSGERAIVGPMSDTALGVQKVEGVNFKSQDELISFHERNRHRRIYPRNLEGFCLLFRRELPMAIGLLDEGFASDSYCFDDFCLRAALADFQNVIAGDVFVHSEGGLFATISRNKTNFHEKWSGIDAESPMGEKVAILNAVQNAQALQNKGLAADAVKALIAQIGFSPDEKYLYYYLADILIDEKRFKDGIDAVKVMPDAQGDSRYFEILGYCSEGLGRYSEAEVYADKALSLNEKSAPAFNLKGILEYKKGNRETAVTLFKKAQDADPGYGDPYTNLGMLSLASNKSEEALNFFEKGFILSPDKGDIITAYHTAISDLNLYGRSEPLFREASTAYPDNKRILFLLIDLLLKQEKFSEAMDKVERAMVHFGIDDGILSAALEIREKVGPKTIVANAEPNKHAKNKTTLSACLIVKNEEKHLARCLNSIKPIVDEIIVVDTGSSDKTRDIATAFGAKLSDFEWTKDFSAARNYSLSQANGDMILAIDADEVISARDYKNFRKMIQKAGARRKAYNVITRNYVIKKSSSLWQPNDGAYPEEQTGTGWFPSTKVRLFPRSETIRFESPVRELVEKSLEKNKIPIAACSVPVHHYGELDENKGSKMGEKYYELGLEKVGESGGNSKSVAQHEQLTTKSEEASKETELPVGEDITSSKIQFKKKAKSDMVSIIIPVTGHAKQLKKCIENIGKYTPETHEIIFVENGCKGGILKWIREASKRKSNYCLVKAGKEAGQAECFNVGMEASSGEYIVLLYKHVMVAEGWLGGMLRCINRADDVGIVGPMTNAKASGRQCAADSDHVKVDQLEEYAAAFIERNRHRRVPSREIADFCMLFRRSLVEQIGPFDEELEQGSGCDDYCLRAALEGYKSVIAGDVFVLCEDFPPQGNKRSFAYKWKDIDAKSHDGERLGVLNAITGAEKIYQGEEVDKAIVKLLDGLKYRPEEEAIYHRLTEMLIDCGRFKEGLDAVNSIPEDKRDSARSLELTGYCKAGLELYDDAAQLANRALSLNPSSASALNLMGVLAHGRDDKSASEDFFKKAIDADPGYGEAYTNLGILEWEAGRKEGALEMMERGFILSPTAEDSRAAYLSAVSETAEFERAEGVFREAKAIYPENRRIAFLLIDILIRQEKYDSAMQDIREAMITFGINDGILSAAQAVLDRFDAQKTKDIDKKLALSLCMIVKNEENCLARCLISAIPVVDEIIIVDTGSTDRTKAIAKTFGAKIYDFEWTDDFSEARNYSLSKVTGNWVLLLDADEVISARDYDSLKRIVNEKNQAQKAYRIITRNYVNPPYVIGWTCNTGEYPNEETGTGWYPSRKVRLFPNKEGIYFENPVHEFVESSLSEIGIEIAESDIPVHHYGQLDREHYVAKGNRYYPLGKKKLAQKGGDLKSLIELAVQAGGEFGKYEEAVALWQKVLDIDRGNTKALLNMSGALLKLEKYEAARTAADMAMKLAPDLKEAVVLYSTCEVLIGEPDKTIPILEDLINSVPNYPLAFAILAAAYGIEGQKRKGFEQVKNLARMGFSSADYFYSIADILTNIGKKSRAISLLEFSVEIGKGTKSIRELLSVLLQK